MILQFFLIFSKTAKTIFFILPTIIALMFFQY